jgi:Flp pilus assembly protein TadG
MKFLGWGYRRGQALIEATLMAPLMLLLFAALVDVGFFCYAAVCTENAARVGALHASSDRDLAASATVNQTVRADVCAEMKALPNVGAACPNSVVTVSTVGQPFMGADGQAATQVTVTYTTVPLFRVPGLMSQYSVTRVVQVRL